MSQLETGKADQQDLATLKARVDNLTANPGESTEGNAELIDIRVGSTGKIYPSAGDATRDATAGRFKKIDPVAVAAIKIRSDASSIYRMIGNTIRWDYANGSTAGYLASFLTIDDKFINVSNKKYMIVAESPIDVDFDIRLCNARQAWGSQSGSTTFVGLGSYSLRDNNYHRIEVLLDLSSGKYNSLWETEGRSQYVSICLTKDSYPANVSGTVYWYIYEIYEDDYQYQENYLENTGIAKLAYSALKAEESEHAMESDHSITADEAEHSNSSTVSDSTKDTQSGQMIPITGAWRLRTNGETTNIWNPIIDETVNGVYELELSAENPSNIWAWGHTIRLGNIDNLKDKSLILALDHISGKAFERIGFNNTTGQWGPGTHIVDIPTKTKNGITLVNIADILSKDTYYDTYTGEIAILIGTQAGGPSSAVTPVDQHYKFAIRIIDNTATGFLGYAQSLLGYLPSDFTLVSDFNSYKNEINERFDGISIPTYNKEITCWGDSLTAGGGWTTTLQTLSGLKVNNGGTGGENARTIVARQGADVMVVNNITIPASTDPVLIASRSTDQGIPTALGYKVTPLLQGGAHVNPCYIGDIKGTLKWTGTSYADMNGIWTFTRAEAGSEVVIDRPTALRTDFDVNHNKDIMIIFIGQNGGYDDVQDLINMHKLIIDHNSSDSKQYLILGLSSGTAAQRADYESAMKKAFGRRFLSLREYLAHPIYGEDGTTIVSCYGLADQGLEPGSVEYNGQTYVALDEIATGTVPHQILADSVHYTAGTKTVIGNLVYKTMRELNILA